MRLDGPSLLIEQDGQASQRFPLVRLSCVVMRGAGDIDFQALHACAASGIAWGCLSTNGEPMAFVLPWRTQRQRPAELLEELLGSPDGNYLWINWLRHQSSVVMDRTARKLGVCLSDRRPEHAYAGIVAACGVRPEDARVLKEWRGLLSVQVSSVLMKRGYSPNLLQHPGGVALVSELTGILAWRHLQELSHQHRERSSWQGTIAGYERFRARDEQRADALVAEMTCWLGGQRWELATSGHGW